MIWMTLIQVLSVQLLAITEFTSAQQCVAKTKAAVVLEETAYFYICVTPTLDDFKITVEPDTLALNINHKQRVDGWSWRKMNPRNPRHASYHAISFTPDAPGDFKTYTVLVRENQPNYSRSRRTRVSLTVDHRGPPEPCWKDHRNPPNNVYSLLSNVGSDRNVTLCVVSQSPVTPDFLSHDLCNAFPHSRQPTFTMSAKQDGVIPVKYRVVFKVTNMSTTDLGMWTIAVNNLNGTLQVQVEVDDMNYPDCYVVIITTTTTTTQAPTHAPTRHTTVRPIPTQVPGPKSTSTPAPNCESKLEAAAVFGETVNFRICTPPTSREPKLTVNPGEWDLIVAKGTTVKRWSWNVASSSGLKYYNISFTPEAPQDFSTYTLLVRTLHNNSKSLSNTTTRRESATLYHRGPPEMCWNDSRKNPQMVHTLHSNLGVDSNLSLCVVSQNPVMPKIVKHEPCEGGGIGPRLSTFNVSATQDPDIPVVCHLVFKVTNMSTADLGIWTIAVKNTNGTLLVRVEVDDINNPTCSHNILPTTTQAPTGDDLTPIIIGGSLAAAILIGSVTVATICYMKKPKGGHLQPASSEHTETNISEHKWSNITQHTGTNITERTGSKITENIGTYIY